MCTYSELKKKYKKIMCNPPPPTQGVNGALFYYLVKAKPL